MTATNRIISIPDTVPGVEILAERERHSKVYDLGRGLRQAVIFTEPVHYQDKDGAWQEIDNALEDVTINGREVLRNRANDAQMTFDRKHGDASFSHGGRTLNWSLLGAQDAEPIVQTGTELRAAALNALTRSAAAQMTTTKALRGDLSDKLRSRLDYANVRPGLSVRYTLNSTRMKQDMILDTADAVSEAALLLPKNFRYQAAEDMHVDVLDPETDEKLFVFESPVTYDANGESTLATVTLEETEDGTVMRYGLDEAFLAQATFPVTIDPVVRTATTDAAVCDAYIWKKNPNTNYGNVHLMRCGHGSGGESLALIKFEKLVKIKASDTILSAQLRLREEEYGNSSEYMGCYPIKTAWTETGVTWNKMTPANTDHISDDMISYVTGTTGFRYFDITPLYRNWYLKDQNFGVAIRYPQGPSSSNNYVEWTGSKNDSSGSPCMYVTYVSHAGRQSWWQYESMSAGRAGTAYVDLYNGNLVYEHEDGGTTGSRMPVAIKHIYNSCLSESNPAYCGNGWRTSMHQQVNKQSISSTNYYVWVDGSATEHYFAISGSQPYKDSEGMELKLNTSGSTLTITDKSNNVMTFPLPSDTTWQNLTKIADALGNTATMTYADGKLTQITDGAGRATTFTYNASGLLSQLVIPGCPTLTYAYSGTNLTGVSYADVTTGGTVFAYEADSNLLTCAQNYDGVKLNIGFEGASSYDSAAVDNYAQQVRRVISLEQASGSLAGAKQVFEYLHMTTRVTAVDNANNDTGKTLTYLFNQNGNVVCTYDELGYATSGTYSDSVANQQTSASKLHKVVINRLSNIDFSTGWTTVKGNTSDTAAQDTSTRCLNMPSLKITKTAATETRHTQIVNIPTAGNYTFSAYVKVTAALTGGLFVRIRSGNSVYASRIVNQITAAHNTDSAADGWDRVYVSANLPAGSATVELVSTATTGSAWFACPQMEEGTIANHVNLLLNGDFSRTYAKDSQTFASDWTVSTGISTNALNGVVQHADANLPSGLSGNAMRIHSYCNTGASSHVQSIAAKGSKGDVFVIGAWLNATSVYSGGTNFKACIISRFKDTSGDWTSWQYNEYDTQRVGWKFQQWAIVAPKDYTEFRIGVQYARNNGTAMFANVFIYREEFGESYAYDDNKNVVSVASLSTQKSGMEYDDADNLKSYRQPGADTSVKYTMDYGSTAAERKKHLLLTSTTPTGQRDAYTYDTYGNQLTATRQKSGGTAFIKTETAYTANGNYVASTKDARGNTVTQSVNTTDGTLTSVTDPAGQTVNYTYDASKRVTAVQTTANSKAYKNAYTYENDRIKTVAHNTTTDTEDVTYTFGYDALGRKTTVKVGTQTLSTNVYENNRNGLLSAVNYGNGGKVGYAYDDYDRLTGVKYDGESSDRYAYEYGANGQACVVRDKNLNRVLQTEHDLADRPMGTQLRDTSGNLLYRTELDYDKQNRLVGFGESAGNQNYKTGYTYDNDNRVTAMTFDGTAAVSYAYDELGRISTRTVGKLTSTYAYVAGGHGTNSTTPLVASITQGSIPFIYAYDNRGNIISETRNGVATTYSYDALGQLIRVNDPVQNQTWVFNYDRGGNIVSRVRYAYTTGTLGTALETIPYTYSDSNWKDKLTAYNGKAITYDAIGNPLNDGVWSYEWQAGRQLKRMSAEGTALTFKYDHNGLRTQKVVEQSWYPEATNYFLHGKLLTHMTVDYTDFDEVAHQDKLHFFYDAQSRPAQVNFNGVLYTYIHNLQGDIVGLLDSTGALVVEYKYDAWGKPIATTGNLADTLGKRNPFRYRGYVYDEETGLYYLRSRYYNPTVGRWINADDSETLNAVFENFSQYNLFAYCFNCPIDSSDEMGTWPSWATKLAIGVGAIVVGAAVVAATAVTGGVATAFVGAAVAGVKAAAVSGAVSAAVSAGTSAVSHRLATGSWNGAGRVAVNGAANGFVNGFMIGGIMAGGSQVLSSGFKIAANAGVPTGRNGGYTVGNKVRLLSPNHPQAYEAGGTFLKIGSKYRNIRLDVGSKSLLHVNVQLAKKVNYHLPIGIVGAGIWGGIRRD